MYMADSFAPNGSIIIRIESNTITIFELMVKAKKFLVGLLCGQVLLLLTHPLGYNLIVEFTAMSLTCDADE